MEDIIFLFFSNLLCYVAYTFDKCFAETDRWRIPEFVLLLLSFLGGAFGALCGMILLPHKSQKKLFRILVPLFLFMQLAIVVLHRMHILFSLLSTKIR